MGGWIDGWLDGWMDRTMVVAGGIHATKHCCIDEYDVKSGPNFMDRLLILLISPNQIGLTCRENRY